MIQRSTNCIRLNESKTVTVDGTSKKNVEENFHLQSKNSAIVNFNQERNMGQEENGAEYL